MEALLYEKLDGQKVRCRLCSHRCLISEGDRGLCGVRENTAGTLATLVYGRLVARHVDPIEKKPIFHMMPGSLSYSIATVGCNFRCLFCQNADIAQMPADRKGLILGDPTTPEAVVADALASGCRSIAYTYTEPTVFFEFALDTARLAKEKGLRNVFVTNGYMTAEALTLIGPYLDAANVDLKGFTKDFYKTQCGSRLEPVKETLKAMTKMGLLVEVTTLLIPGLNDDENELKELSGFIASELGPGTPWHVSRFHPTYRLTDRPPTPIATLTRAREIGLAQGLLYVYTGNIPGDAGEHTFCPKCQKLVIERRGFQILRYALKHGQCQACGERVHGVGM